MKYHIKVQEIDNQANYPILVLSGLTGLGQHTIKKLSDEGNFGIKDQNGELFINGGEFKDWSNSVNHLVDVEKTNYSKKDINE